MNFFQPKQTFGFIPDSFDPKDFWRHEFYAGEKADFPKKFVVENLSFKDQGQFPFCGAMACTTAIQQKFKEADGREYEFSQMHMFFHGGGQPYGSSIRGNLDVAVNNGVIPYKSLPLPEKINDRFDGWYETLKKTALNTPFRDAKKIPGYARVIPTEAKIKTAILEDGGLIVPVAAYGAYFTQDGSRRVKGEDNHLVYLKGWDENFWYLHDSLSWKTNGERRLSLDYQFASAYSVLDLPANAREISDAGRAAVAPNALDHYGQKRNFERETAVANELVIRFKAFKNQSVFDAAGIFWPVYINAIAYGGYSYTDVINSCYNWRRTGQQIFDFNRETRLQWAQRVK